MAEKVDVPESENSNGQLLNRKSKRRRCCTCCLVALLLLIIILAAAFGVGWYFGDKFTQENLDMSLGDTLGVVGDLYWTNDKDVVNNPFDDEDLDGFYREVKRNILLKEDVDVDFVGALDKAVDDYLKSDSAVAVQARKNAAVDSADGAEIDSDSDPAITDILVGMVAGVLDRENIDSERLNAYNENDPNSDSYIFNLKDRQLAAFVNMLLNSLLKSVASSDDFADIAAMIELKSVMALKQICFTAQKDGDTVTATTADITVWVGLQKAAGQALTYLMNNAGVGWLGGLARWLGDVILPENVYVTLTVPLYGDDSPQITLNGMNASKRERMYKLVNGVFALTGSDKTIQDILNEYIGALKPFIDAISEEIPLDNVEDGSIKIDILSAVAKMASDGSDGDPLTKSDFIYMLQALLSDSAEQYKNIEPFRFENYYSDADGHAVYIDGPTELVPIDYEQEFINEIEKKYAVKFDEGATLAEVLGMIGVSLDGSAGNTTKSQELMTLLDAQEFHAAIEKSDEELKLQVTDRMLGAVFSTELQDVLLEEGICDLKLKLDSVTFISKSEHAGYTFAKLCVELDILSSFGTISDGGLMTEIIKGLMPETVFLSVTVDITRSRAAGQVKLPVEYQLNACLNTDRAIAAFEKVAPSLGMNDMSQMIDERFNDMLDNLDKLLDIELVTATVELAPDNTWVGENASLVMPDIFTVITQKALVDSATNKPVLDNSGELKSLLKALDDTERFASIPPSAVADYKEFIAQVIDKYYLKPADGEVIETFDELTDFMTDFNTGKFRVYEEDQNALVCGARYIAYDKSSTSELKPVMDPDNLGALLNEKIKTVDSVKNYEIIETRTKQDGLTVVLAIAVSDLLPENVAKMLNTEIIYVTAEIDTRDSEIIDNERYPVTITVNNMETDGADYLNTLKIVRCFDPDFNIEDQVNEVGKIMFEQMSELNKSIAGDSGDGNFLSFTPDGLVMIDFYTFLANKMDIELSADNGADGKPTPDELKDVVQGMYVRIDLSVCGGEFTNDNNYVSDDIIVNCGAEQPVWTSEQTLLFGTGDHTVCSDIEFNGFMRQVESIGGGVVSMQTIALKAGMQSAVRAWLADRAQNERGQSMDENTDYLVVTFKMGMDDFMITDNDAEGLYPSEIYATIVYEFDKSANEFRQFDIIFNGMTHRQFVILQDLMKLHSDATDPNRVNIGTVAARTENCLKLLTDYGDVTISGHVDVGIGSIIYKRNNRFTGDNYGI